MKMITVEGDEIKQQKMKVKQMMQQTSPFYQNVIVKTQNETYEVPKLVYINDNIRACS